MTIGTTVRLTLCLLFARIADNDETTHQGAQLAEALFPLAVAVPVCVDVVPTGVDVPAKVNSMTPMNSAARA